ncbi:MAG: oligopeptide transporter, OPT family [Firmicutes bacterium]|nr:oligopeptide transporter, OPT family [Bacillota bacterium]
MKKEFKPYISADQVLPEITKTSVIIGVLLAVVFGAANAYLGLRVGLTISASIPAAVISMGVIRMILKRDSILENNIVQTMGSAGESVAAGCIFTLPVIFLWAKEGLTDTPSLFTITVIALCGGLLGIFFMVPLRSALIVREHETLPYPEGTACAQVLIAGDRGGSSAKMVFIGMGAAAVFKLLTDGVKVIPGVVTAPLKFLRTEFSVEAYPALLAVGYICGFRVSSLMFAGGVLGWLVLIPMIVFFGGDATIAPSTDTVAQVYAEQGATGIWSNYLRYIGAGAVVAAGFISLGKSMPLIISTFRDAVRGMRNRGQDGNLRTAQDLDMRIIIAGVIAVILVLWFMPQIPVSILGAVLIVVFGFFFCTVSSRMVGLVGSSNNPVSGMTIATLLFATVALKVAGNTGINGMMGAIAIGSVICIATNLAGDTSQDLKTGFLLGATPRKQQVSELIGIAAAALVIGGILILLDKAWGFGSVELSAPQAMLMKLIIEGVMEGNLPWMLIAIGVFISIAVEFLGVTSLAVAIGLYLPLEVTAAVLIGGLLRKISDWITKAGEDDIGGGILFTSGLIAGEGLMGILLAVFAVTGIDKHIDLSGALNLDEPGGVGLLLVMAATVLYSSLSGRKKGNADEQK